MGGVTVKLLLEVVNGIETSSLALVTGRPSLSSALSHTTSRAFASGVIGCREDSGSSGGGGFDS